MLPGGQPLLLFPARISTLYALPSSSPSFNSSGFSSSYPSFPVSPSMLSQLFIDYLTQLSISYEFSGGSHAPIIRTL